MDKSAHIPMKWVGPLQVCGDVLQGEYEVPLATFEKPLWPSVARGARVSMLSGKGICCSVVDERMTRSVLFETPDAATAINVVRDIEKIREDLKKVVQETSRFATLIDFHVEMVAYLLFIRFEFSTGDAAGHNMCTQAAEALMNHLVEKFPVLKYGSLSGNYCSDKKATAVNGILGRGKHVIAEVVIPEKICQRYLKTSPEKLVKLTFHKNWVGSTLAGGLRSANAHFANMLLAFYLATGQDAANIVEGSQGTTFAEVRNGDLYFSVSLPHLIVGTVGNGKELAFVQESMKRLDLLADRPVGENARRLACLCAATVLCGELSLLAALTNPDELMNAHRRLERK